MKINFLVLVHWQGVLMLNLSKRWITRVPIVTKKIPAYLISYAIVSIIDRGFNLHFAGWINKNLTVVSFVYLVQILINNNHTLITEIIFKIIFKCTSIGSNRII